MSRFLRFAVVGVVGLAADAGMLALLLALVPGLGAFAARLLSILFAVSVTWGLNRRFAFGASGRHLAVEGARYGGVSAAASLVNYLAYSAALLAIPALPPLAALAFGSLVATAFSFAGYSRLVFTARR